MAKRGRVSRRLPATVTPSSELSLLPVENASEPAASDTGSGLYPLNASSCCVEFRHGKISPENPSSELLAVLLRALTGEHLVIIGTCRLNGIDPETYLRHILNVLPEWPSNKMAELLPWNVDHIRR